MADKDEQNATEEKPVIAVSRCLLGDAVRYDGGSCRVDWVVEVLSLHCELVPLCPEMEADLVRARTKAGLAAARQRGTKLGRPRSLTAEQVEMARAMMVNPKLSARQIADQLGVHRATLYRSLRGAERSRAPQR